jgi:hypothetical protein
MILRDPAVDRVADASEIQSVLLYHVLCRSHNRNTHIDCEFIVTAQRTIIKYCVGSSLSVTIFSTTKVSQHKALHTNGATRVTT